MNRRFKKIFRPDTGRLPNEREELLKMINGIPMHFPKISEKIGVTDLDSEKFARLLAEHLEPYIPFLGRKEHHPHVIAMIKGRLSDLERKSMEPIALVF
jgi:hypothetical protein